MTTITAGMTVGAERWPYSAAHPGCWGRPWSGVVLERDDPRAWEGTLAFGRRRPTREEARAHLGRVGGIPSFVPVLWDFGDHLKVYWEPVGDLRPYAADVAAWEAARVAALAREKGLRVVA